ncbi:DEAD/DEAH box helicase [Psychrobacter immobilis]|uniref:DEAD/DEAH box helicase n=1 Tax=Psychrobacter immobilis TaxID=498 RepID=UPI003FCF4032
MLNNSLIPVAGCLVKHTHNKNRFGTVISSNIDELNIRWLSETNSITKCVATDVSSGLIAGVVVIDKTPDVGHQSLGQGLIVQQRVLAGFEQFLVDFKDSERKIWMPYQHLVWIKESKDRYIRGDISKSNLEAERLRLRTLANAIELWNENSGALSHLDIDPLPHQINLVHHILASGNLNWLIADDVGLGKTIETGMLIHALKQRNLAKRVLLVTPAGLVKQWQEEMYDKFNLEEFEIYDEDFKVDEVRKWKLHDYVIGSIDKLKNDNHIDLLLAAEPWDLIIFDEGHRLSRKQYGMQIKSSERFILANKLRNRTKSLILLSATPHQGEQDKFVALLELLRPERRDQLATLNFNPEIMRDMVFRNHKADVTDHEGNFIFKGKTVHAINVPASKKFTDFELQLAEYFKLGYSASTEGANPQARAIGFVMTTYRKLAASSIQAIHQALLKRIAKIEVRRDELHNNYNLVADGDERFVGENEEYQLSQTSNREFFDGELVLLKNLISASSALLIDDQKFAYFKNEVVDKILSDNPSNKILIFSEYRNTQEFLRIHLEKYFGEDSVSLINGSMSHDERRKAIEHFETKGVFLISTEAGGEGINLQRACNIMINYDLPWNPMRLVQRIGRLYRYGQKNRVAIFNLYQPDSLDQKLIISMYNRIDQIVDDLSSLQNNEYNEGLKDEILGEISNQIDVENVLSELNQVGITRTHKRIQDALDNAKNAVEKQRELLDYAASSNVDELKYEVVIDSSHIHNFVIGMLEIMKIEHTHHPEINTIRIRFDEELQNKFRILLGKASIIEVTTDRTIANDRNATHLLDLSSLIMQYFIKQATSYSFGGLSALINTNTTDKFTEITTSILKWQDLQGYIIKKQLCICYRSPERLVVNPDNALDVFLIKSNPIDNAMVLPNKDYCKNSVTEIDKTLSDFMASNSNRYLQPSDIRWISVATT